MTKIDTIVGHAIQIYMEDIAPITPTQPPGTEGLSDILGWVKWLALIICVVGLIIAGAMMAIQSRRGEGGEHAGKIGMALAGVIVISAATSVVGFLA